jgi:cytoskeletal protein CcmA (bactofilin family)
MWKRDRSERVELEQVLTERPAPVAPVAAPVAPPPGPTVTPPRVTATPRTAPQKTSTLGSTLRFKGELVCDEDLLIEGHVEGSILHSRSLTIGAEGRVVGDTRGRRLLVEGTVDGDLYALESVTLRAGATMRGNVLAPRITIEEGARLSGRIDMDNAPSVPTVDMPAHATRDPEPGELSDPETEVLLSNA